MFVRCDLPVAAFHGTDGGVDAPFILPVVPILLSRCSSLISAGGGDRG